MNLECGFVVISVLGGDPPSIKVVDVTHTLDEAIRVEESRVATDVVIARIVWRRNKGAQIDPRPDGAWDCGLENHEHMTRRTAIACGIAQVEKVPHA